MRVNRTKSFLRLGLLCAVLGVPAAGFLACADALHLDPPGTITGTGGKSADGGPVTTCESNPDCAYPTPVCNTIKATCVQCLVVSDCASTPGTVCSQGSCVCPTPGACLSSAWTATTTLNAPEARSHHVAVWTGSQMVVWGGMNGSASPLNTGGRYDPVKNVWTPTSAPAALDGRYDATAVWDGADGLVLVWGGVGANGLLNDGWRYNPATDAWTPMASLNPPPPVDGGTSDAAAPPGFEPRTHHTAVWATGLTGLGTTKAAMIVWGGTIDTTAGTTIDDGQIYDPAADKWIGPIPSGGGGPGPRANHAAVWSSNGVMVVYGGATTPTMLADNTTYTFTPGAVWNSLSGTPPPGARQKHTGLWDPLTMAMLVWGGVDGASMYFQDGAALSTGNTWTTTGGAGSMPEGRVDHSSVVMAGAKGSQLVVFGGDNATGILGTGWALDTSPAGVWSSLPTPGPAARKNHTAVATGTPGSSTLGTSMIVWGGETAAGVYTNSGAIYTAP